MKNINGVICEPIEHLIIEIPEEFMGVVMEKLGLRKAEMMNMSNSSDGYLRLEFKIPARGLLGYRSQFMTDTKGNGTMHHIFHGYEEYKGEIPERTRGSLVAFESGETTTYGLYNAQERGCLFIGPGVQVYEGMIVGENAKSDDIEVNVCKKKHVTNMRAAGSDEALRLTPYKQMSLEECLEFITADELVEVTPESIRLRKKILDSSLRQRQEINFYSRHTSATPKPEVKRILLNTSFMVLQHPFLCNFPSSIFYHKMILLGYQYIRRFCNEERTKQKIYRLCSVLYYDICANTAYLRSSEPVIKARNKIRGHKGVNAQTTDKHQPHRISRIPPRTILRRSLCPPKICCLFRQFPIVCRRYRRPPESTCLLRRYS